MFYLWFLNKKDYGCNMMPSGFQYGTQAHVSYEFIFIKIMDQGGSWPLVRKWNRKPKNNLKKLLENITGNELFHNKP